MKNVLRVAVVAGSLLTTMGLAAAPASAGCIQQQVDYLLYNPNDPEPTVGVDPSGKVTVDASGTVVYLMDDVGDIYWTVPRCV